MKRRPAKQPRPEPPSIFHRFASAVSDLRVLLAAAFALVGLGGVAFAFRADSKYASKQDLAPISAALVEHNAEIREFRQAVQDIRENEDREMQWLWELRQQLKR